MSKLQIGSITVIVNGYTLNNGLPYFQRAVPQRLQSRLGKKTIKIRLKPERGNIAVQCHRLSAQYDALFKAMDGDPRITPTEEKIAAVGLLATYGLSPLDAQNTIPMPANWEGSFDPTPHINEFLDNELAPGFTPTSLALKANEALFHGLPTLLSEAFSVYLDNHKKSGNKEFKNAQQAHWDKLISFAGDIAVEAFSREQARKFRDHRLEAGIKPVSVKREISTIKAIFEKVIVELSLNLKNPFEKLTIKGADETTKRPPFTKDELGRLLTAARVQDDERRRLVVCLALTGARLAEIVGLRKQDVDLVRQVIVIQPHSTRSLKTGHSKRRVPMHPWALEALEKQLAETDGNFVFPTYANDTRVSADSASATLKKWIATVIPDTRKTAHSMRHSMADLMREANAPTAIKNAIGGWASQEGVSSHYGEGYSDTILRQHLLNALSWLPSNK